LVEDLTHALRTFSPRVERVSVDAFLLDAGGLDLLFGDAANWAKTIAAYLRGRELVASITVGFSRDRALALARARRGISVVPDPEEERDLASELRLPEIGMSPELADALGMLGVHTLGEFLALPAGEVASRLGPEAAGFHGRFVDDPQLPIQPEPLVLTPRVELELGTPDDRLEPLLFAARGPIDELLSILDRRGEALRARALTLCFE
jgi:protein ImuB